MIELMKQLMLALGLMSDGHMLSDKDLGCVASTVYGEARGESEIGQALVAQTILNRTSDSRWPDSPCAVVGQHLQFTGFSPARTLDYSSTPSWTLAVAVTNHVFMGAFNVGSCSKATHFHNTTVQPTWSRSARMIRLCRVDNHIFYKELPNA